MTMNKRSLRSRALALLLALACAMPLMPALSTEARAVTQAQIDALEAERDEIKAEREGMQLSLIHI